MKKFILITFQEDRCGNLMGEPKSAKLERYYKKLAFYNQTYHDKTGKDPLLFFQEGFNSTADLVDELKLTKAQKWGLYRGWPVVKRISLEWLLNYIGENNG